jgi:hypothetical protein
VNVGLTVCDVGVYRKESLQHLGNVVSYYSFSALLCTLVVLHVYWFWLILRVAVKKLVTGKVDDVREEDD